MERLNRNEYQKTWRDKNRLKIRERNNLWMREKHQKDPRCKMLAHSKNSAKNKNIEHNINLSDIIIPDMCPVLNIPIIVGQEKRTDNSPSIDRIDNSKGYIKGNIIIVSWRANNLKSDSTLEELEKLVRFYKDLKK